MYVEMPIKENPNYWILKGAAFLCEINNWVKLFSIIGIITMDWVELIINIIKYNIKISM